MFRSLRLCRTDAYVSFRVLTQASGSVENLASTFPTLGWQGRRSLLEPPSKHFACRQHPYCVQQSAQDRSSLGLDHYRDCCGQNISSTRELGWTCLRMREAGVGRLSPIFVTQVPTRRHSNHSGTPCRFPVRIVIGDSGMETKGNAPEPVGSPEAPENFKGAEVPTSDELDEMTGGLNLVNKASCTSDKGSMNTVVSVGGI